MKNFNPSAWAIEHSQMVIYLMLVIMAVVVAVMLLAFYLPLFQAISAVQRSL